MYKTQQKTTGFHLKSVVLRVEVAGFEPAAFWSRTKRATKLRYTSVIVGQARLISGRPRREAAGSTENAGADKGTRTPDLLITNQSLYRLSYIGTNQHMIL